MISQSDAPGHRRCPSAESVYQRSRLVRSRTGASSRGTTGGAISSPRRNRPKLREARWSPPTPLPDWPLLPALAPPAVPAPAPVAPPAAPPPPSAAAPPADAPPDAPPAAPPPAAPPPACASARVDPAARNAATKIGGILMVSSLSP